MSSGVRRALNAIFGASGMASRMASRVMRDFDAISYSLGMTSGRENGGDVGDRREEKCLAVTAVGVIPLPSSANRTFLVEGNHGRTRLLDRSSFTIIVGDLWCRMAYEACYET
uniref:Uncharacterized protein n=1 Tax=Cucumis melo TaxID=3656 RepID=A0A9I9E7J7_CUCME